MELTQTPTQEPVQTLPEIIIPQPKPNYFKTIIFSILGVLLVSSIIYLYLQNQTLKKQALNPPISPTVQAPSSASQPVSPTPKTSSSISIPPDETAVWKTYSDSKYNFKYPDVWLINPTPQYSYTSLNITNIEKDLEFSLIEKLPGLGLENLEQIKIEEITINGKLLEKTTYRSSIDVSKFEIWLVLDQGDFVKFNYNSENSEMAPQIFDQILSTFKFTDVN